MNRIAVAFIDDGINKSLFPALKNLLNYKVKENKIVEDNEYTNDLKITHASICLSVFLRYNKKVVDIISIRVLNEKKLCNVGELILALNWVKEKKIPIVNMSLGTSFYSDKKLLKSCINDLSNKGIVIIAAQNNNDLETFPASFTNVIGVMASNNHVNLYPNVNYSVDGIEFCAKSIHTISFSQNKLYTSNSNSFSVPYVTALVTNELDDIEDNVINVRKKLNKLCGNNIFRIRNFDWCQNAVIICSRNDITDYKYICFNIVKKIFYENIDINDIAEEISNLMHNIDTIIIIDKKNKFHSYEFIEKSKVPYSIILNTNMFVNLNKEYCLQVPLMNHLHGIKNLNFNQVNIPIVIVYYKTNDITEVINLLKDCEQKFIDREYGCRCFIDNGISMLYGFDNIENLNSIIVNVNFYSIDLLIIGLDFMINYGRVQSDIAFEFCKDNNFYADIGIEKISSMDSLYNNILNYFT